jgi:hypothetical protein
VNWGVLAVAVLTFLTAVVGYLGTRRQLNSVQVKVDGNLSKVTDLWQAEQARSAQLAKALERADVEVPKPPAS